MQRKEGAYLSSLASAFGMKLLLPFPLHLLSTLSSPPSSSLVSHVSSKLYATQARELSWALEMEWARNEVKEVGRGEVGRRGKFWGREGGWKIPGQGKRMCFWFIPKTAWTASSWTGALVAAGSVQPNKLSVLSPALPKLVQNHKSGWKQHTGKKRTSNWFSHLKLS